MGVGVGRAVFIYGLFDWIHPVAVCFFLDRLFGLYLSGGGGGGTKGKYDWIRLRSRLVLLYVVFLDQLTVLQL